MATQNKQTDPNAPQVTAPSASKPARPRAREAVDNSGADYATRVAHSGEQVQRPTAASDKAKASAKDKPSPQATPTHYVVRPGRVLFWPNQKERGRAGYVVSADDPFIKGREAVLIPAPPGSKANEIDDPVYSVQMRRAARGLPMVPEEEHPQRRQRVRPPVRPAPELDHDVDGDDLPDSER